MKEARLVISDLASILILFDDSDYTNRASQNHNARARIRKEIKGGKQHETDSIFSRCFKLICGLIFSAANKII